MSTPIHEVPEPSYTTEKGHDVNFSSDEEDESFKTYAPAVSNRKCLTVDAAVDADRVTQPLPSQTREQAHRLGDDLAMLEAEREVTNNQRGDHERLGHTMSMHRSRSRSRREEPVDQFDTATHPIREQAAVYKPPENPTTSLAKIFKKVHDSSFLVRYFVYITPVFLVFLIPLLVGALVYRD